MEMPEVFTVLSIQTKPKLAVTMARNIAIYNSLLCCWFFLCATEKFCIATQLGAQLFFLHLLKVSSKVGMLLLYLADKLVMSVMSRHTQIGFNHLQLIVSLKDLICMQSWVFGLETWDSDLDSDCNYELTWIQKDSGGLRLGHFGHRNFQTNSCHV